MKDIPSLGIGIGFRPELKSLIFLNRDTIGFVEIIAEHYMDVPAEKMQEFALLKKHFTVIPHAINLSLGSTEGIDHIYVQKLKKLIEYLEPPYWSEHISYTKAHGIDIGHLAPIVYNDAFLEILLTNIREVKKYISQPLILENITYHIELPGRTYDDATFLNKLCDASGCGLLLDLTNLYINSCNLNFDPFQFMDALNKKNIRQLHYVGIEKKDGQLIDTHAAKTPDEIFQLMKYLLNQHKPQGILLERDDRFEMQEDILDDLLHASAIYNGMEYADR
jgi:uncharacterized protein (UPF0276 family)